MNVDREELEELIGAVIHFSKALMLAQQRLHNDTGTVTDVNNAEANLNAAKRLLSSAMDEVFS